MYEKFARPVVTANALVGSQNCTFESPYPKTLALSVVSSYAVKSLVHLSNGTWALSVLGVLYIEWACFGKEAALLVLLILPN